MSSSFVRGMGFWLGYDLDEGDDDPQPPQPGGAAVALLPPPNKDEDKGDAAARSRGAKVVQLRPPHPMHVPKHTCPAPPPPEPKLHRAVPANMPAVDGELLEMLTYMRPHESKAEEQFIERFIAPLQKHGKLFFDEAGNRILHVGFGSRVVWSCHTDTVHHKSGRQIATMAADGIITTPDGSCLGADNGAGIYVLIRMIRAGVPGTYIFHRGEERGGIGSRWRAANAREHMAGALYAIAFDRRDTNEIITHQGGQRTCSDAFAHSLAAQLGMDHKPSTGGSFTDTKSYIEFIAECTNVGVGYGNGHCSTEWLDWPYVNDLAAAMEKFDESKLVCERKPGVVEYNRAAWHSQTSYGKCYTNRRPSWPFGDVRHDDYIQGAVWVDGAYENPNGKDWREKGKYICGHYSFAKCKASDMPKGEEHRAGIDDIAERRNRVATRTRRGPNRHDRRKARGVHQDPAKPPPLRDVNGHVYDVETGKWDDEVEVPSNMPGYSCYKRGSSLRYRPIKGKVGVPDANGRPVLVDAVKHQPASLTDAMTIQDAWAAGDDDDDPNMEEAWIAAHHEFILIDAADNIDTPHLGPTQDEIDEANAYFATYGMTPVSAVYQRSNQQQPTLKADVDARNTVSSDEWHDLLEISTHHRHAVTNYLEDVYTYHDAALMEVVNMTPFVCTKMLVELGVSVQELFEYV